jgi:hypothetical protein
MGLFDRGKSKREKELRGTGTRVPAQLVEIKGSKFDRVGADGGYHGTDMTMTWEAQTPDGKKIRFEDKARWAPEEGIWLEAACDEAGENAALILDLSSMNPIDDDQDEIRRQLRVSREIAEKLRDGKAAPSPEELGAIDGAPPEGTKSLKDLMG